MVEIKLFSGTASKYLAERIADSYGYSLGQMELLQFSDGEMQPIIHESVRG
jgi:ribose-phosphate pyrophosphokinase